MTIGKFVAVALALVLVGTACSTSDGQGPANGGSSGSITISGSSTVEPISALNAEAFRAINPDVGVSVEGPGTGDGFKKFCAGETDISGASRAIKDTEVEACRAAGIEFIEVRFAIDGLSVLTSKDNTDVACLTFNDLYALLGPESTGFTTWDAADRLGSELEGTNAPYIDRELVVTAPGEESGTYDSFVEVVIEDTARERGQIVATRPDYTASANDNIIIEGIAGSESSLGWVGFAFFLANQDKVKALEIDSGNRCVAPTPATIASGDYPIARPLFIYVNKARAESNRAVSDYVDFYLSDEGLRNVDRAGYVRLASYDDVRSIWENRETGTTN